MAPQDNVQRVSASKLFRDNRLDPPQYVDEEIPSVSVVLGARNRRGILNKDAGTAEASFTITGSLREFIPGTYGLRVTRVSVVNGSAGGARPTNSVLWYIRHSREGTVDVIRTPRGGGQVVLQGDPMRPIYTFGPGTVLYAFAGTASAGSRSMHVEGFTSVRRPDQV